MSMPASATVVPVIMSGGAGTRLWPLSTDETPKQFHALASELTMLQDTARRMRDVEGLSFGAPIVICNRRHEHVVTEQLAAVGAPAQALVLEPFGRNTAAVAAMAALAVARHAPGALALLLPADHVIAEPEAFCAAVARALDTAADRIVTFGITPTAPETGFGYIQQGDALAEGVFDIVRFAEKPARAVAEAYLEEGGYAWNAGIFLFSPAVMLEELEAHRPAIRAAAARAFEAAAAPDGVYRLDDDLFAACPSEAVDTAVMEPTKRGAVAPVTAGWADIGSWSELWRMGPHDADRNVVRGQGVTLDTRGSLIWADGPTVAVLGLDDVVVVASGDRVMVAHKSRAQDVKKLVEAVAGGGKPR